MPRSSTGYTVSLDGSFSSVGTSAGGRSETEVVVGRDVECSGRSAGQREGIVFVDGCTVEADDGTASNAGDGSSKAFVESLLQATSVERVEIGVECGVALLGQLRLADESSGNDSLRCEASSGRICRQQTSCPKSHGRVRRR